MIVFDGNILTPLAVLDPLTDPHKSAQRVSVETTTSFGRSSHFKIPLAEVSYPQNNGRGACRNLIRLSESPGPSRSPQSSRRPVLRTCAWHLRLESAF